MKVQPATVAPLNRLGGYRLEEKSWSNPPPPRGASGEELRRFWLKLLRYHTEQMHKRNEPCGSSCDQASHSAWKYGQKIEIKVHESVIDLLHRILAPAAPFLCAHDCPHVDAGATPDQLRRFIDSIDAHAAKCRENAKQRSRYGTYEEDQAEEAEIMRDCRRYLQEATGIVFPPSAVPEG